MPIYEYFCDACKVVSSFLLLRTTERIEPYCRSCGSKDVRRVPSRVTVLRGEEKRMESLLDPSNFSDLDENDPGSIERVMKRMGSELGGELGEELGRGVEQTLSGQPPTTEEDL